MEEMSAWDRVRQEVAAGRQAYVVCPLVEESERIEARSAIDEYERLRAEVFGGLNVALIHGQLPEREKDAVMSDFRRGAGIPLRPADRGRPPP